MRLRYIIPILFLLLITSVSAEVVEDIPIGKGIAEDTNYAFDWRLDDADLPNFMDTQVIFQGVYYDIHDELFLRKDSPSIETSLTSAEDDYGYNVFMEVKKKSIYYMLMIDDFNLNISKSTSFEPFEVDFLGKKLKIIDVPEGYDDRFTAIVGERFYMKVGEVVTVDGKQITLVNVGAGGQIEVDVDGYQDMVPAWNYGKIVNGIEIFLDETFYDMDINKRAAVIYIGNPAVMTYRDEDAYIGEDEAHPQWKWAIGNLGQTGVTAIDEENIFDPEYGNFNTNAISGPFIAIYNNFRATTPDDNIVEVGECYRLPNNYAEICFDSQTINEYLPFTIEYIDGVFIHIYVPKPDALVIPQLPSSHPNGTMTPIIYTQNVWLQILNENEISIYYKPATSEDMVYLTDLDVSTEKEFLKIDFFDTTDDNIKLNAFKNSLDNFQIKLDINGDSSLELNDGTDDLITNWGISSNEFFGLGLTQGLAESSELLWGDQLIELGEKDEGHVTKYGIIIESPLLNGASDKIMLGIPRDQVQANVVIKSNPVPEPAIEPDFILLGPGEWNLFSLHLTPEDTTTETVISDIQTNVDVIYGYENGQWKIWRNGYPSNTLINLEPGKGYFAKLIGDQPVILNINGTIGVGEPPVIPTFNVYQGWNLIGYYGTKDVSAQNALINIDGKYSAIWTLFDELNTQSWQGSFEGLDFNEPLKRTHGYWLYMQEDGVIVPTN